METYVHHAFTLHTQGAIPFRASIHLFAQLDARNLYSA